MAETEVFRAKSFHISICEGAKCGCVHLVMTVDTDDEIHFLMSPPDIQDLIKTLHNCAYEVVATQE